jgi:hypothetical protein
LKFLFKTSQDDRKSPAKYLFEQIVQPLKGDLKTKRIIGCEGDMVIHI